MQMTSKSSRKRKHAETVPDNTTFKKGDFIKHPSLDDMIIVDVQRNKIHCKQFSKRQSTKIFKFYLKKVETNWFISDRYMVEPLTIDQIHPWRQTMEKGSIVMFLFEQKKYKTMVIHRDQEFVTLQPIGCHFTYVRHIHSMSIVQLCGYSDIYDLVHVFEVSEYIGATCKYIETGEMIRVIEVDVGNNMLLIQYRDHSYEWISTIEFFGKFSIEMLVKRPEVQGIVVGQVDFVTKDDVMANFHLKNNDIDLLMHELSHDLPTYIIDLLYHSSSMYYYASFQYNYLAHTNNTNRLNRIITNIMAQKMDLCISLNSPSYETIANAIPFINKHFDSFMKGMRLNELMHRHQLFHLECVSIVGKKVKMSIVYNGVPPASITNGYKNRTNAYLMNRMMIHFFHQKPQCIKQNWYEKRQFATSCPLPLMPYQQIAVSHMIHRETHEKNYLSHAFENNINGMTYNYVNGCHNHTITPKTGGILQMDVGLGKTICSIALFQQLPIKTLVIVPLTLIDQWKTEIKKFLPECNVTECYGRRKNLSGDIVLTTYGTVRSMYQTNYDIGPFQRIIFDESHSIKSLLSITCRACAYLKAPNRWCLTATPIHNTSYHTIVPQLSILGCEPYRYSSNNRLYHYVCDDIENYVYDKITYGIIIKYTREALKQHTLSFHQTDVIEKEITCKMEHAEKTLYNHMLNKCKQRLDACTTTHTYILLKTLVDRLFISGIVATLNPIHYYADITSGTDTICTNSTQQIINRIGKSAFNTNVKKTLTELDTTSCCICMDTLQRPTITRCLHIYCYECINQQLNHQKRCPMCRKDIHKESLIEISEDVENITEDDGIIQFVDPIGRRCNIDKQIYDTYQAFDASKASKISSVKELIESNQNDSILIFSKYTSVLQYLKSIYPNAGLITGSVSRKKRKEAIESFQQKKSKIFLLSVHCASVGLTLTSGSHMVFMEPIVDINVRKQAIGRINRIGQDRSITIHTLINDQLDRHMVNAYIQCNTNNTTRTRKQFFIEEAVNYFLS